MLDDVGTTGGSFHAAVRAFKREIVRSALGMHSGNKLKAARELGISRCYLHRLLNQLHIIDGPVPEISKKRCRGRFGADHCGRGIGTSFAGGVN